MSFPRWLVHWNLAYGRDDLLCFLTWFAQVSVFSTAFPAKTFVDLCVCGGGGHTSALGQVPVSSRQWLI